MASIRFDSTKQYYATSSLVVGYALCSSLLAVINKFAITKFNYPGLLTALQYLTSALGVWVLGKLGFLHHDTFTWETAKKFLPAAFVFYLAIFTNTNLLRHANVDTFIVFRSCTPLLVALADTAFRKQPFPSKLTFVALLIILGGAVGYVATDSGFKYVWNYISHDGPVPAQPKNHWACERFISNNASVAIPWCGMTCGDSIDSNATGAFPSPKLSVDLPRCGQENGLQQCHLGESSLNKLPFSSPDHFSFSHGFFSDSLLPKGTATWPEEKLPTSSSLVVPSAMCKSQLKFLKTSCQSMINSSHAWGKVIVTAGWDGRIRVFQNYGLPIG